MDPRILNESSPAARLAAVARSIVMRMARCSLCQRDVPPNKPDYADLRQALNPFIELELIKARLAEAKLANNHPRIRTLQGQLDAAYLVASKAAEAK
jgi:hypothetical protein